jgi:hypothetical protein
LDNIDGALAMHPEKRHEHTYTKRNNGNAVVRGARVIKMVTDKKGQVKNGLHMTPSPP